MTELLFVCTGNLCRSPMGAAFVERLLEGRVEGFSVHSAGLLAAGHPPTAETIQVMSRRGLDLASHRSHSLPASLYPPPDLVIGMGGDHVRAVLEREPNLVGRTFTLKELARRARAAGPRLPGESMEDYLKRLGDGRQIGHLARIHTADDVPDPIGKGLKAYESCAAEIEKLVVELVDLLWPAARSAGDREFSLDM
jgi:protein-tyrosine phosphatase